MCKREIAILIILSMILMSGCRQKTNKKICFNYLATHSLLPCGEIFAVSNNDKEILLLSLEEKQMKSYCILNNAVEAQENHNSQTYQLIATDAESIYYGIQAFTDSYGIGNGYRVYRYYPETKKTELVYKDIGITNFDALLGLENVFNFYAPVPHHTISSTSLFFVCDNYVLPEYKLFELISSQVKQNNLTIKMDAIHFDFCITNDNVFFVDYDRNLYLYKKNKQTFTCLPLFAVKHFFVTNKNLFIIPSDGSNIKVCDLEGNLIREIDMVGAVFTQRNCLFVENNQVYIKDIYSNIWTIDDVFNVDCLHEIPQDSAWTVREGRIYTYDHNEMSVIF